MIDKVLIDAFTDQIVEDMRGPDMPEMKIRMLARERLEAWLSNIATKAAVDAIINPRDIIRKIIREEIRKVMS